MNKYRKIPKISPWAYIIIQRPFSEKPIFGEAYIYGGKFASQSRLGLLIVWTKFMSVHVICNLYKGFTETRLEDVDLSKTQPWKYLSIWTKKIQAKSEDWTTQTAINCDAFWLQSFSTCNSSSANMYKKLCVAVPLNIALFYFVFEGNFLVQALGCLYSEGQLNGGFFLRYEFGGLYLEGLIFGILWYNLKYFSWIA